MDTFSLRQAEAVDRQGSRHMTGPSPELRDVVAASPDVDSDGFSEPASFQTVTLPASTTGQPLSSSLVPVDRDEPKPAREAASYEQKTLDMDAVYRAWTMFDEKDMESSVLYNEKGEALKRYKGDAS